MSLCCGNVRLNTKKATWLALLYTTSPPQDTALTIDKTTRVRSASNNLLLGFSITGNEFALKAKHYLRREESNML